MDRSVFPDVIRYITNVFPTVQQPKPGISVSRYAIVYLLLKNIVDLEIAQASKMAVVWDMLWWQQGETLDGIEVFAGMVSRMPTGYCAATMLDFLECMLERYMPARSESMKSSVAGAMGMLVSQGRVSLDKFGDVGVQSGVQDLVGRLFPGLFVPPVVEVNLGMDIVWDFESKEGLVEAINRFIDEDFGPGSQESSEFALLQALIDAEEGFKRARMLLKEMYWINRARDKPTRKRIGDLFSRIDALGSGIDYRVLDYALDGETSRNEIKWARHVLENHIKPEMEALCVGCLERNIGDDVDEFYRVVIRACRVFPATCSGNIKVLKLVFGISDPASVSSRRFNESRYFSCLCV
jgi:hypothetical protein